MLGIVTRRHFDGALLEVGVETAREPFCRVVLRPASVGLGTPFGRTSRTLRIRAADAGAFDVPLDATCRNGQGETEPVGVLPARLLAMAYDTAYARWVGELAVNGQDLPLDAASAGLSGAVGYFAGAGRVAVPLLIVEE